MTREPVVDASGTNVRPATQRDPLVDLAKAVAIVAIVLGHVVAGLKDAGLVDGSSRAYAETMAGLYSWHLAVFVLLSGAALPGSAARAGAAGVLRRRAVDLTYLYALWFVLQGIARLLTSPWVNDPPEPADLLRWWVPTAQLWYLPMLLLVTAVTLGARPWADTRRAGWATGAALVVSVVCWGVSGPVIGTQGLGLAVFFVVGSVVGLQRLARSLRFVQYPVLAMLAATSVAAVAIGWGEPTLPSVADPARSAATTALGMVTSLAAVVAVLLLCRVLMEGNRTAAPSHWVARVLGTRSLEIFLAHVVAVAGVRILLVQAGMSEVAVLVVLGTAAGVAASVGLAVLAERWPPLRLLFAPPRRPAPARTEG